MENRFQICDPVLCEYRPKLLMDPIQRERLIAVEPEGLEQHANDLGTLV